MTHICNRYTKIFIEKNLKINEFTRGPEKKVSCGESEIKFSKIIL